MSLLGYYEYASRLVNQFRALLVSANQVVIPVVAEAVKSKSKEYLFVFYIKMKQMMLLLALPLSTAVIILTPFISKIWIGEVNVDFLFSVYVLMIGTIFNIISGPAYFSCMGEGRLSLLVFIHAMMGGMNFILGYALGYFFGGYGTIIGWGVTLMFCSLLLSILYQKRSLQTHGYRVFSRNDHWLMFVSCFIIISSILYFSFNRLTENVYLNTIFISILLICYIPVLRKNDNFKNILLKLIKK
jgi:O-antigen/teichoic acid export membrane protein